MNKLFLGLSLGLGLAAVLCLSGCDEDHRKTDEKINSPAPDFTSRNVMACPKCGAPTAPYRISAIKSYYHCSGQPPKFPYHEQREWQHTLQLDKTDNTEH
jgi:hypothetical protein